MLKTDPAVFAVDHDYQIMVPVTGESLFWVRVGDQCYYDEANGIMRSLKPIHRVTVPMAELDKAGTYTVCEKELIERKPYFPTSRDTVEKTYCFHPVRGENLRAYHIADAHNHGEGPVLAAKAFGNMDFLIMNGDIPNHSGEVANFDTIYEIAAGVTHGEIPVVFARGNHDLRGFHAEEIADYTPNQNGNTYYSFRLGNIWGLILDCGEDKHDDHAEYGFTVSCTPFRRRQIAFMQNLIAHADMEFAASGVDRRLVIVHNPFVHRDHPPFDPDQEIYAEWARLLREEVRPDLMICGHVHTLAFHPAGEDWFTYPIGCPVAVVADPGKDHANYRAAGFTFAKDHTEVSYTNQNGETFDSYSF